MKLKRLILKNFKNFESESVEFAEKNIISGENAAGKSTYFDAYAWLFFDTDSLMKSAPEVRMRGKEEPVSVMAVIETEDGKEIEFEKVQKRTISEDGTEYKDANTYFVNSVKMTKRNFEEAFPVKKDILLLCSFCDGFIQKKPDEMRKILLSGISAKPDEEIADNEELSELLSKNTVEEITAKAKQKKKDCDENITKIDAEIRVLRDQIKEKEDKDISEMELLKKQLEKEIDETVSLIENNSIMEEKYKTISDGILELKFQQNNLTMKEQDLINKERNTTAYEMSCIKDEIEKMEKKIDSLKNNTSNITDEITAYKNEIRVHREKWEALKSAEMDENCLVCPTCGRPYEEDEQEKKKEEFNEGIKKSLLEIEKYGKDAKEAIEKLEQEIKENDESVNFAEKTLSVLKEKLCEKSRELSKIPEKADISGTPEYIRIQNEISEKEEAIKKYSSISGKREQLRIKESDLRQQLVEAKKYISDANTEKEEERIEELTKEKREVAQTATDAQRILSLLTEFEVKKAESLQADVNKKFSFVEWKLFERGKAGTIKNTCTPMVDGFPITNTMSNKAKRILGKIDICQSMQRKYGIKCPIFIDDGESLDANNLKAALEMVENQVVIMVVSDEKLKIKNDL